MNQKLFEKFPMGVEFSFNNHKQAHQTIEEYIDTRRLLDDEFDQEYGDVVAGILKTGNCFELTLYTSTVGHYDLMSSSYVGLMAHAEDLLEELG